MAIVYPAILGHIYAGYKRAINGNSNSAVV